MSSRQKREISTFVRDIVSVGIRRDFERSSVSNSELVQFGIYIVALHRMRLFQDGKTEQEIRLAPKHVTDAVAQYFGKSIRHQSVGDWKYRNGFYNGYGELFEQLGPEQIKRLRVDGVGKPQLTVYADYVHSMASADSDGDIIVKTKMTLKRISSKGKSRYILTSYKSLNKNYNR